ncbi:41669_t:CDS:2, partial [Gigaspora margarita]
SNNELEDEISNAIREFPFNAGWALKENMKLGKKGAGKHMMKKVIQYLQSFFLAGNLKAKDHYSPEDMHANLEDLAANGELTFEEIPSVKTIKGWIGRYSANFKKDASEKALLKNKDHSEITSKCQRY